MNVENERYICHVLRRERSVGLQDAISIWARSSSVQGTLRRVHCRTVPSPEQIGASSLRAFSSDASLFSLRRPTASC